MKNNNLKGIFVALVTPFAPDGSVAYDALATHVRHSINSGIEGFYVCGSTGEALLLTLEERKHILEIVVEAAKGRCPVICHCGAVGTQLSSDLARHAVASGVDAVSSVSPFYYHFSSQEIIDYYKEIADACGKPVIVYNIPSLSGVSVTPPMMHKMCEHPEIIGLKFTSNDLFSMEQIKTDLPNLIVYNGFDEMLLAGLSMGADGAIGSTYNVMGKYFVQIRDLFLQNRMQEALVTQRKANGLIASMSNTGKLFACLKYIISLRGIPFGDCRRPFAALNDADIRLCMQINKTLIDDGIV